MKVFLGEKITVGKNEKLKSRKVCMIFVTVGTHEQQFNRLIEEVDRLKGNGFVKDEVIIQTGFCTYKPKYCTWSRLLTFEEMEDNIKKARIVITHGGPASFIAPLRIGKVPIVVPRQKQYGEHVNDHQMKFCLEVEKRMGNIIVVDDVMSLLTLIREYDKFSIKPKLKFTTNNKKFNEQLGGLVKELK